MKKTKREGRRKTGEKDKKEMRQKKGDRKQEIEYRGGNIDGSWRRAKEKKK